MCVWKALCLLSVLITVLLHPMKSQVLLEPSDVQVCPDSEDLVVLTCNVSGSRLQWRIMAPPMFQESVTVSGSFNKSLIGMPVPFESPLAPAPLPGISFTAYLTVVYLQVCLWTLQATTLLLDP